MSDDIKRQVPAVISLLTYFVMLVCAMALLMGLQIFSSAECVGVCIQLAPFFPCGLGVLAGAGSRGVGFALIALSYASFAAFLVAFVRARSWVKYGCLCFGFAVLLLLNVAGCREMQNGFSRVTMRPGKAPQPASVASILSDVTFYGEPVTKGQIISLRHGRTFEIL